MNRYLELACEMIEADVRERRGDALAARWALLVPRDDLGLTAVDWADWALDIVHRFTHLTNLKIDYRYAEIEPLHSQPLRQFASYLEVRAWTSHFGREVSDAREEWLRTRERSAPATPTRPPTPPTPVGRGRPATTAGGDGPSWVEERLYRVWYGTNRRPAGLFSPHKYSKHRGDSTRYGCCDVHVPESHEIGSIGSSLIRRLVKRRDDRLKVRRITETGASELWAGLNDQLAFVEPDRRHAVVFVHGYNVSFTEAALRAAQIGYDLGIEAMAFFSWPSRGKMRGYLADGASIEASETAITDFLTAFAENVQAEAVHVIAHSMGNRGVMRAVARIAERAEAETGTPFDHFVLAAADVDADTFRAFADHYARVARRTTLYVSSRDRALSLSRFLHDYHRIGFWPPVAIVPGMDTISVSELDMDSLGHGYVAEAREVLVDLHQLLFADLEPAKRFSLKPAQTPEGESYWTIAR